MRIFFTFAAERMTMRRKIFLLLFFISASALAQKNDHVPRAGATLQVVEHTIDSTIVKAVSLPHITTGDPSEVFTDDTGCTREYAISQKELAGLLQILQLEPVEEQRLQSAFRFARKTCLNATQITQICKTFGLEKTRLTFAKFAFSTCVDPKNYSKVYAVFTNKASATDLNMFITGR